MPTIARERRSDGIEILRLDRPEVRNAMDTAMLVEMEAALDELAADGGLRALVFSTTDARALCAGADVSEVLDAGGAVERMERFARFYAAVEAFPAPTIAVCVGNCVGAGAELAAGVDLRVGGDNLKLAWPGGRLGVPVGPARLTSLVGLGKAKELIYTGRVIGAEEAQALGLLTRVVAAADAEAAALELAAQLAEAPAEGLRRLKELFREYDASTRRVERENAEIIAFQRDGAGVPAGGMRGR